MWEEHGTLIIGIGFFIAGYFVGWQREWKIKRRIIRNAAAEVWGLQDENDALRARAAQGTVPRP